MRENNPHQMVRRILGMRTFPSKRMDFLKADQEVFIYGAGNCGKDVFDILTNCGIVVTCFLDGKLPGGSSINGLPVFHPNDPFLDKSRRGKAQVIISIFNAYAEIPPIMDGLNTYGYRHIMNFLEFHRHFHKELGDRYWLTNLSYYDSVIPSLVAGFSVWSDTKSRALYSKILEFRCSGNYRVLPRPEECKPYFDHTLPPWNPPYRFIDCGSFDGDTLKDLNANFGTVENIVAFEPDPVNFQKLCSLVESSNPPLGKEVSLFPCGVWSRTTQLNFISGKESGSNISKDGAISIQCTSLDDALHGLQPTFIKMDIEGAEYQALLGSYRTIRKWKPRLAICLYHRPEHIWQIPILLKRWDLGYKFFLRSYCFSGFELVLYAL